MNNKKLIQQIADKAGIPFSTAVIVLRKMSNMQEVKDKLNNKKYD